MLQLRPYQQEAIEQIRSYLQAGMHRQLVRMATGLGKTPLFASLPDALGFQGRMLVLVHREELASQAADKLRQWNPGRTVGIEMAAQRAKTTDQLIVGSVQTLGRSNNPRLARFSRHDFDAVVIDECHHATAQSYRTILDHFGLQDDKHRLFLGVTATPNRADGQQLGDVFQEVVYNMGILEGIQNGWLADLRGYRVRTATALDSVRTRGGDFALDDLQQAVNTATRNHLVARAWKEYAEGRQTIAYAVDIQHARELAEAFCCYGVVAEAIWGDDPDRRRKLERHRAGDITVLVNCQVLAEGYDDWRVGAIVLARPTQSELLYTQVIGRGTRIPENITNLLEARRYGQKIAKEDCLLLDVVDASRRHNLVTLPTLFGLHHSLDLRGTPITEVLAMTNALQKAQPQTDPRRWADLVDLRRYVERLDLFRNVSPAELLPISRNRWQRQGKGLYTLQLKQGEMLTALQNSAGHWQVLGNINGQRVMEEHHSLQGAIQAADAFVDRLGGRGYTALANRDAKWRTDKPTPAQLQACRQWGLTIAANATKGDVHDRLDQAMAKAKARRTV